MLAKIHLRTACGCTRELFHPNAMLPMARYVVPISGRVPWREGDPPGITTGHTKREFALMNWEWRSTRRIELWYEEIVYVG
jgi:hypothetical protein